VVLDTVVFVRALLNPHSGCGRVVFDVAEECVFVTSPPMLRELLEVLRRPELVRRFSTLSDYNVVAVIGLLREATVVQIDRRSHAGVTWDASADMFVATALAGDAAFLVSEDAELLSLGGVGTVSIVDCEGFVRALGGG
jgi:uncharacterized protein